MRIIKEMIADLSGDQITCPRCGGVLEYEPKDINLIWSTATASVKCPCCDYPIPIPMKWTEKK